MCFTQLLRVDLCPQEGNLRRQVHGLFDFVPHCELVALFLWQDEGCVVEGPVALHLVIHVLVSDGTTALLLETDLGLLALPEEVGQAMRTFRVDRAELGRSVDFCN